MAPPSTPIDTRAGFLQAVTGAVDAAAAAGVHRLLWVDPDFTDWPLDDPALLQALAGWLRLPQRRLILLGARYDVLARQRPRFMAWYRTWSHAVAAFAPAGGDDSELPTVLVAEGVGVLQLMDRVHWRGRWVAEPAEAKSWAQHIDALLQQCEPALPATTLGL